jgi:polysaccharide export outer membrane protein
MRIAQSFMRFFLGFIVLGMISCTSSRHVYYLKDISAGEKKDQTQFQDPIIHVGDQLSVFVSSPNLETATMFNMPNYSTVTQTTVQAMTGPNPIIGYLVDVNGNILLPKAGELHVEGLTFTQAKLKIEGELSDYIKDPVVSVRCLNFRISVMGEVSKPGLLHVPYHEMNLLQALSMAGDLTINGIRTDVIVIRQEFGKQITYHVDLTDPALLNHPVFHLQSGDMVYVKPNKTKINTSSTFFQVWPTVTSAVTLLVLVLTNIK